MTSSCLACLLPPSSHIEAELSRQGLSSSRAMENHLSRLRREKREKRGFFRGHPGPRQGRCAPCTLAALPAPSLRSLHPRCAPCTLAALPAPSLRSLHPRCAPCTLAALPAPS